MDFEAKRKAMIWEKKGIHVRLEATGPKRTYSGNNADYGRLDKTPYVLIRPSLVLALELTNSLDENFAGPKNRPVTVNHTGIDLEGFVDCAGKLPDELGEPVGVLIRLSPNKN